MADLRSIEYPLHIANIPEFKELDRVSDAKISELMDEIEEMEDNIMILTSSERGIARREKILGIIPGASDELDDRRFRVQSKWYDVYPYTYLDLKRRLDTLCGAGGYTIDYNTVDAVLTVKLSLSRKQQIDAVKELLEKILPLWIIYDVDLLYNTHDKLSKYTHDQLHAFTHDELRGSDKI